MMEQSVYGKSTQVKLLRTLLGHRGAVQSVVFSHDGRHALSAGNDGLCATGTSTRVKNCDDSRAIPALVYSAVLSSDDSHGVVVRPR